MSCTPFIFIVTIQAVVLQLASSQSCGNLPANCRALDDSCLRIRCSSADHTAWIQVSNCTDPVQVDLSVSDSIGHQYNRTYSVSGEGHCGELAMNGTLHLTATYDRNASHLTFAVSFVLKGDQTIVPLVPSIKLPLNPAECMCSSIHSLSDVSGGYIVNYMYMNRGRPCSPDTNCSGMYCNIEYATYSGGGSVSPTHIMIDPCAQSVRMYTIDSTFFDQTVNDSDVMEVTFYYGFLNVTINHYNYSMEVSMSFIFRWRSDFLPLQRIILDRTGCTPFTSFPAAPVLDDLPCSNEMSQSEQQEAEYFTEERSFCC